MNFVEMRPIPRNEKWRENLDGAPKGFVGNPKDQAQEKLDIMWRATKINEKKEAKRQIKRWPSY